MKKWTIGILAVMMLGASPWTASVHAEINAETKAAILAASVQEVTADVTDADAIAAIEEKLAGLSEADLKAGLELVIKEVPANQQGRAVRRYMAAAKRVAVNIDDLDPGKFSQDLEQIIERAKIKDTYYVPNVSTDPEPSPYN